MPVKLLKNVLSPILRVKKDEWPQALLSFMYFFLVITALYIIKPVRDSLFIGQHGAKELPFVKILIPVVLVVLVWLMVGLVRYLRKNVYLSSCVAFSVIVLLIFWWQAAQPRFWIAYTFYVWVGIYSVLNVTLFWTAANDIFDVREAKRLFGFVGSGGILGGIVGSCITAQLATVVGTRSLLLIAAFLLLFCIPIINVLWAIKGPSAATAEVENPVFRMEEIHRGLGDFFRALFEVFRNRYLFIVLILISFAKIASSIIDYQFKNIVDVMDQDKLTASFGMFYLYANVVSLMIQFFFTSMILRKVGVVAALFLLPIGVALGSLGILIHPGLWIGLGTWIYDKGMNYSLNQTTKEVLYLPVDRETRYRVKPVIDMVGYRAADTIGNILIIAFTGAGEFGIRKLSLITLAICGMWVLVVIIMKGDYRNRLRTYLAKGPVVQRGNLISRSMVLLFGSLLDGMGKHHREERLFLIRNLNVSRNIENAENLKWKIQQTKPGEAVSISKILEEERRSKHYDQEIQDLLEKGTVEEAGERVLCVTQYRTRSAQRIASLMQKSSFASIRLAGTITESAFFTSADYLREHIARLVEESKKEQEKELEYMLEAARKHAPSESEASAFVAVMRSQKKEDVEANAPWLRKGGWVVNALVECINEQRLGAELRYGLPAMLTIMPVSEAVETLQELLSHRNTTVRFHALKSLNKLKVANKELAFNQTLLEYEIAQTTERWHHAFKIKMAFRSYCRKRGEAEQTDDLFIEAQDHRMDDLEERIFRLLGLFCGCEESFQIYNALQQTDAQLQANAMELLDEILPPRLKTSLLDILDEDVSEFSGKLTLDEKEVDAYLRKILMDGTRWNGLSAMTLITRFELDGFDEEIKKLTEARDPLIRNVAKAFVEEFILADVR